MKEPGSWILEALSKLLVLGQDERNVVTEILEILLQVERRKGYVEMKCDDLYSFCIQKLRYTESQAYQRTQAVRALMTVPELKGKIETGSTSVTTVAQVQVFLRQERAAGIKRTQEEKETVFASFENKTAKEVKRGIAELKGTRLKTILTLELDEEAELLWKSFREESLHQTMGDSLNCFKLLLKTWNAEKERVRKADELRSEKAKVVKTNLVKPKSGKSYVLKSNPVKHRAKKLTSEHPQSKVQSENVNRAQEFKNGPARSTWPKVDSKSAPPKTEFKPNLTRYIPKRVKIEVLKRDRYQCTLCKSKRALEFDHFPKAYAEGGGNDPGNLRILCRSCNLKQGIDRFGPEAMKRM